MIQTGSTADAAAVAPRGHETPDGARRCHPLGFALDLRRMSSRGLGIRQPGWLVLGAILALGLLVPETASAQAQKAAPIRVSYQPGTY